MKRTEHRLADVVDIDRLRRICDDYVEAGGMALAVLDPDGTVLVASGWQDICTHYHRRNDTTLAACLESDLRINDRILAGLEAPEHVAYKCANGLWDVAFPLVVDGEHLANLFTGQFFYDDDVVDVEGFRRRARELGFDEKDYLEALGRVPVVTHERVERTIRFLTDFVAMLSELGCTRLQRDRDHAALLESEERYRQLFEAESDAVFLIDNETGCILEANGAAAIMYGYGRDEMLALTNEDLSAEPEQTQAVTHGTPVVSDQVVTIPLRIHRRRDGSNFPVEITGRFFMLEGRAVHVAAIRDISERQNAAETLSESREVLRAVLDAIPVRVFWKDRDLTYLGCNAPFARDAGFEDPEDLVGKDDYAMGWREQADLYRADDRLVIDSGEPRLLVEEPQTTPAGERLDLLTSKLPLRGARGEVIGVLGTYYDITERKRAERALHQSQRLYETFINATDDMAFLKDEELRYIIVNEANAAFFGLGVAEVVGRTDADLMPAASAKNCRLSDEEALHRGSVVVSHEEVEGRVYETRKFPVHLGDDRRGVGGYVRDVTERTRAQEALRQNEELLRGLFDTMPSGAGIYEVRGDGSKGSDYIVKAFNATSLRIEGKTRDEVVGKSLLDLRPTIDEYGLIPVFQRVWQTGEPAHFPSSLYVDERYTSWYENRVFRLPSGEIVAIYDDVTERVQAEEAAAKSADNYQRLFDASLNGMAHCEIVLDEQGRPVDYRFLHVNDTFEAQTGLKKEDVEGRTIREIIPGFEKSAFDFIGVHGKVALTGEETEFEQYQEHLRRWYSVHVYSPRKGQFISMFSDITERMEIEQEILRLNDELETRVLARTEALVTVNRELESFAYSISHDLRAPLRALDGFSEILLQDYSDVLDEEGRGYLRRIKSAANHMAGLMDGLLQLSRVNREELVLERIDLSQLAGDVVDELRRQEPGRKVDVLVEPGLLVEADPKLMRVALANLIGNAWKFTSSHEQARIEVGAQVAGAHGAAFYVKDDGAGFDPRYARNLFGAFQRLHTPDQFEGTGIGLATVQRIVHRHGGTVWAEGQVEQGATFWFTLAPSDGG